MRSVTHFDIRIVTQQFTVDVKYLTSRQSDSVIDQNESVIDHSIAE